MVQELNVLIKGKREKQKSNQEYHLYHGETWELLQVSSSGTELERMRTEQSLKTS